MLRNLTCSGLVVAVVCVLWAYAQSVSDSARPFVLKSDHPIYLASSPNAVAPWSAGDVELIYEDQST